MEFAPHTGNNTLWQNIDRSPLFDISQYIPPVGSTRWFFNKSNKKMGCKRPWHQIPDRIFTHDETGCCAGPLGNRSAVISLTIEPWRSAAGIYPAVALTLFFIAHWKPVQSGRLKS